MDDRLAPGWTTAKTQRHEPKAHIIGEDDEPAVKDKVRPLCMRPTTLVPIEDDDVRICKQCKQQAETLGLIRQTTEVSANAD